MNCLDKLFALIKDDEDVRRDIADLIVWSRCPADFKKLGRGKKCPRNRSCRMCWLSKTEEDE